MKIGIVGGTGGMGEGFAMRWCFKHDVVVGSRDGAKAKDAAEKYAQAAAGLPANMQGSISGTDNESVAKGADLVILSIPYESIDDTCSKLAPQLSQECLVVSPIVPMARTESGFTYIPMEQSKKTAAEMVADKLPPRGRVLSAFHTIAEAKLKNIQHSVDVDTFVCGDDLQVVTRLTSLIAEIPGLRPLYLGPLSISYQAEMLTPMILNAARKNKLKNPGLRLIE
jgi:NADPH-dependent F420 reductase